MVMYREYSNLDGQITPEAFSHYPTIITFEQPADGEYSVINYLMTVKLTDEVRASFPWYLQGKLDTQDYVKKHTEACNRKAAEHFEITYEEAFPEDADIMPTVPTTSATY